MIVPAECSDRKLARMAVGSRAIGSMANEVRAPRWSRGVRERQLGPTQWFVWNPNKLSVILKCSDSAKIFAKTWPVCATAYVEKRSGQVSTVVRA
jgi:hypothetical protein